MSCMENNVSYVEHTLIKHAKEKNIPINGSLELLPLCNMNCNMCYVRLTREEMECKGRLRTVDEWLEIGSQMKEAGVLFLLLTGGEPLLYPDFKRLYVELRKMGFIITINTNGTLIDKKWAVFFSKLPPRRINVTLYGADEKDYEKLCHYSEGFQRTINGIRLLREHSIDVKIGFSLANDNKHSMNRVFCIGKELGVLVHVDHYMMPAKRERNRPFSSQSRVLPEDSAKISLETLKLQFSNDIFNQYVDQAIERVEDSDFPRGDGHVSCLAGNCSFTVNWQGQMRPCIILSEPSVSVFDKGFDVAWKEISPIMKQLTIPQKCIICRYKPICKVCVAAALLETGSYEVVPDYLCRYSEEYYRLLKKEQALISNTNK